MTKEEFIERSKYANASEVSGLMSRADGTPVNPFGLTPSKIYWAKKEPEAAWAESEANETKSTKLGTRRQGAYIGWLSDDTGIEFLRHPFPAVCTDGPLAHILRAAPDGLRFPFGAEVKGVGPSHADDWGDPSYDVPLYVRVQCVCQIMAWNFEVVHVGAEFWGGYGPEFKCYVVEPDQDVIDKICEVVTLFWERHVKPGIPPDDNVPMWVLKRVPRIEECVAIDGNLVELHEHLKEQEKEIKAQREGVYERIVGAMTLDDGTYVERCDGGLAGGYTYRSQAGQAKIDREAMKRDGVWDKYATPGEPHPVLRFVKPKTTELML